MSDGRYFALPGYSPNAMMPIADVTPVLANCQASSEAGLKQDGHFS